jgi:hypothetical protein
MNHQSSSYFTRLGPVGRGSVWHGRDSYSLIFTRPGASGRGSAAWGMDWRGKESYSEIHIHFTRLGKARTGGVWCGLARRGEI